MYYRDRKVVLMQEFNIFGEPINKPEETEQPDKESIYNSIYKTIFKFGQTTADSLYRHPETNVYLIKRISNATDLYDLLMYELYDVSIKLKAHHLNHEAELFIKDSIDFRKREQLNTEFFNRIS